MKTPPLWIVVFAIIIAGFLISWVVVDQFRDTNGKNFVASGVAKQQKGNPITQGSDYKKTELVGLLEELREAKSLSQNSTQQAVRDMTASFISRLDPSSGTSSQDILNQVESAVDEKTLAATIKKTQESLLEKTPQERIKKDSDQSQEALVRYKKEYEAIMGDFGKYAYGGATTLTVLQKGDSIIVSQILEEIHSIIERFENILVPTKAQPLHESAYLVLQNTHTIFTALSKGDSDPLRAYIAIESGFPLLIRQSETMGVAYAIFIKENKL